jgi:preprotein translocase subunit SecD
VAGGEPAAAVPAAVAWWQTPGAGWLIALAVVAGATFLAWLIAKSLRVPDMWGRIATVLVALTAGLVICRLGWPPRLGIDLKGGLILVYEVDNSKQSAARVDDAVRRVEGILKSQDGSQGTVRRRQGGGMTVRLATADSRAREAFTAAVKEAEFDRVQVREVARRDADEVRIISCPMIDTVAHGVSSHTGRMRIAKNARSVASEDARACGTAWRMSSSA